MRASRNHEGFSSPPQAAKYVRTILSIRSPSTSSGHLRLGLVLFHTWHLYILFCDQKTFYIGITDNIWKED
ncbi:MAG: hypothetical protein COV85_03705 [Candidatus Portnoybacteria bacterium CG11_big_fil_rev_8_21_14_0_20_44_10]|uniref:GIY-YIG domain-containing protein n=2 Tax=Candidatus Portnoyibacteriota TaxID=1817913 RepID=A0A2H0KS98_9BACT|nr:MAG: hypothetical protein COV85_03705 [Candidatus Portnoybacteria bacterium CG11_big_fil_rev_8_21_14_0_20_44_10]PJA62899.1 MAG: hypothetical protein CO161_03960 [Candidatus Portnoybacteria bacterium CG_4_9_14_3_um_filter_44_9]